MSTQTSRLVSFLLQHMICCGNFQLITWSHDSLFSLSRCVFSLYGIDLGLPVIFNRYASRIKRFTLLVNRITSHIRHAKERPDTVGSLLFKGLKIDPTLRVQCSLGMYDSITYRYQHASE